MKKISALFKNHICGRKMKIILLIFLVFFHLINNFFWVYSDPVNNLFCGKDWQTHIRNYDKLLNLLKYNKQYPNSFNKSQIWFYDYIFIDTDYPPLYYWIGAGINFIFGKVFPLAVLFSSTLFFVFLIIIIYKLGEYLKPGSGLLAAFICSFFPVVYKSSKFFNLEVAVSAMVALSMYLFFKTKMFENRFNSILLGLSLGLGMLTKYTFFIFLFGPLVAAAVDIFKKSNQGLVSKKQKENIILCLSIGIMISIIYYNNVYVLSHFFIRALEMPAGLQEKTLCGRFFYYIHSLIKFGIGGMAAIFIFFLSVLFFKTDVAYKKFIYLWCFLPFIFLSISPCYYQYEYIIPMLSAIALISSIGVYAIRKKVVRYIVSLLVLSISLIQILKVGGPSLRSAFFSLDSNSLDVYKMFKMIGEDKYKTAYISNRQTEKYFYGIEPLLAVCSKNLAQVDNFNFSSFNLNSAGEYDFIITAFHERERKDKLFFDDFFAGGDLLKVSELSFYPYFGATWECVEVCVFGKRISNAEKDNGKNDNFYIQQIKNYFSLELLINMSRNYRFLGNYEKSALCLEKALCIDLGNYFYDSNIVREELMHISKEYRELGRYEESLMFQEKALCFDLDKEAVAYKKVSFLGFLSKLRNRSRRSYEELDELFIAWDNPEKAVSFYKNLDIRCPNNKDINLRLARQYKLLQDYNNSKKYFQKVLEIAPNCEEAQEGVRNADFFLSLRK